MLPFSTSLNFDPCISKNKFKRFQFSKCPNALPELREKNSLSILKQKENVRVKLKFPINVGVPKSIVKSPLLCSRGFPSCIDWSCEY